ncbi:hypothetical protein P4479_24305, partial [Brevibacillus agri]
VQQALFISKTRCEVIKVLYYIIQFFVSVIFVISAAVKVISFESFSQTVLKIGISAYLTRFVSVVVILLEFLGAFLILFESTRMIGGIVLQFLLCSFALVAIRMIRIGQKVSCNCFGSLTQDRLDYRLTLRIFFLSLLNMTVLLYEGQLGINLLSLSENINLMFLSLGIFGCYILLKVFTETFLRFERGKKI